MKVDGLNGKVDEQMTLLALIRMNEKNGQRFTLHFQMLK